MPIRKSIHNREVVVLAVLVMLVMAIIGGADCQNSQ
jgi:hypothetical protein